METLYRKVSVSERLPEASGYYWIEDVVGEMKSAWFFPLIKDFAKSEIAKYWLEPIPDPTAQLQADKAELLEALHFAKRHCKKPAPILFDKIEPLIQKHKQ